MAFLVFQCLSQLLSLNYYHAKHCYYSRNFSTFKTIFERLGNSLTFEKKSVFRLETVHSSVQSVAQVKQKNWQKNWCWRVARNFGIEAPHSQSSALRANIIFSLTPPFLKVYVTASYLLLYGRFHCLPSLVKLHNTIWLLSVLSRPSFLWKKSKQRFNSIIQSVLWLPQLIEHTAQLFQKVQRAKYIGIPSACS